ncbi:thiolase family protein [Halorientalis pallida]|uniref:thiolase family protein n=1 Tax=Halorientalis pallida TaxID=2479928 RepID=UPI001D10D3DF|nr:thiolase family protein [Halorientalis pallida]
MTDSDDVVLVDAARTPHGELLGSLAPVEATGLGRTAIDGLLDHTGIDPSLPDWVCLGNAIQAGVGQVPARQAVVESDLPTSTPATTVNEASGSGLRAITLAADRIDAGRIDFAIAGGMESMSNAPHLVPDYRAGRRHGNGDLVDAMICDGLWDVTEDAHMGELTERMAEREGIGREQQDEYALRSHRRAAERIEAGAFDAETVPVTTSGGLVERDEGPRPDSTAESLADLQPAFRRDGTITPANASKLADGAGCALVTTAEAAHEHGFGVMAELVDYAVVYREPARFNEVVADALRALLDANDLGVDDVDHFEINEAFAAQTVYVRDALDVPEERLNPDGGAVAFGHPIGASGGMLVTALLYAMEREDATYGVVGMSVGGGGAIVALLER